LTNKFTCYIKINGRTKRGRKRDEKRVLNMPAFIDAKNLQPFINKDLGSVLNSIEFQNLRGNIAITLFRAKSDG
jgi:hypothetical protein